jgi:excisionase family DNA binding protein
VTDLADLFGPELVAAIEQLVDERVEARLAELEQPARFTLAPWLTLEQAAERLGCTTDAVRMRAKRGRLESRRQGRRLYISADSVDRLG